MESVLSEHAQQCHTSEPFVHRPLPPCRAMPCLAMPCRAVPLQCNAVPCHAVQCVAVRIADFLWRGLAGNEPLDLLVLKLIKAQAKFMVREYSLSCRWLRPHTSVVAAARCRSLSSSPLRTSVAWRCAVGGVAAHDNTFAAQSDMFATRRSAQRRCECAAVGCVCCTHRPARAGAQVEADQLCCHLVDLVECALRPPQRLAWLRVGRSGLPSRSLVLAIAPVTAAPRRSVRRAQPLEYWLSTA